MRCQGTLGVLPRTCISNASELYILRYTFGSMVRLHRLQGLHRSARPLAAKHVSRGVVAQDRAFL
jgi:hypothetical protein